MAGKTLKIQASTEVSDLDSLAKQIDAAHVEVLGVLLTSVQKAAEAGRLLAQAKAQVPYGQWEAWVAENTAVSSRTARNYMQIEKHWAEATSAKRQSIADLGVAGFLSSIAQPRPVPALSGVAEFLSSIVESAIVESLPVSIRNVDSEEAPRTITARTDGTPAQDPEHTGISPGLPPSWKRSGKPNIAAHINLRRVARFRSPRTSTASNGSGANSTRQIVASFFQRN